MWATALTPLKRNRPGVAGSRGIEKISPPALAVGLREVVLSKDVLVCAIQRISAPFFRSLRSAVPLGYFLEVVLSKDVLVCAIQRISAPFFRSLRSAVPLGYFLEVVLSKDVLVCAVQRISAPFFRSLRSLHGPSYSTCNSSELSPASLGCALVLIKSRTSPLPW